MTTYYVATNGSDSGSGASGSPWRTISKAMQTNLKPGDDVVVRSGIYKEAVTIDEDGSAAGHITLRSEVPGGAKIDVPDGKSWGINVKGNYVTVDGFEVYGSPRSGITGSKVHHVKITDNISHDNKTGGIYFSRSEFLTVEGNVTYDNANYGVISGISIHLAQNITGDTTTKGFRIIVKDNVSYNNITKYAAHTDGNGIIIDDFQATKSPLSAYRHPTLVEGNITYNNGSSGVQVFSSDYVTVRGNVAWHNNTDLKSAGNWRGEIQNTNSSHNTWTNNIAVTDPRIHKDNTAIANVSFDTKNGDVTWVGNVTFNGTPGADSIRTSSGNAAPSASNNKLGVNPGLDFSDILSMARSLGASTSGSAGTADPDTGTTKSGGSGNNTLSGADGADQLYGNGGNDQLYGNGNNDKLYGGDGADKLYGGSGADYLRGGKGNDLLQGGLGKDILIGDAGADDFVFKLIAEAGKGSARDVIRDFSRSQGDDIHLSGIDANAKVAGNQAFGFIGDKAFSGKAGELQYKGGIVAGDVNGDKAADFHIEIANKPGLGVGDFIL